MIRYLSGLMVILFVGVFYYAKSHGQEESSQLLPPSNLDSTSQSGGYIIATGTSPMMYCVNYVGSECSSWSTANSTFPLAYPNSGQTTCTNSCLLLLASNTVCPAGYTSQLMMSYSTNYNAQGGADHTARYYSLTGHLQNDQSVTGYDLFIQDAYQNDVSSDQPIQFTYIIFCLPQSMTPPYNV